MENVQEVWAADYKTVLYILYGEMTREQSERLENYVRSYPSKGGKKLSLLLQFSSEALDVLLPSLRNRHVKLLPEKVVNLANTLQKDLA